MSISYDLFTEAFLSKITEYEFLKLDEEDRVKIVDGYMHRSLGYFKNVCDYDFSNRNDEGRTFEVEIPDSDIDEIVDIVSEGMVVQWLKPHVYKQELLENILNTKDYSTYSPAELLLRVKETYTSVKKEYQNMVREYSYNHGDLTRLHL